MPSKKHDNPNRVNFQHQDKTINKAIRSLLEGFGEDLDREGLRETPARVTRMYHELLAGYQVEPSEVIRHAVFNVEYHEMIVVRDIDFYSLCEHHLLPFFGKAHVAYIPNDKIIGLSKIPRIVDIFARRLQIQERLTRQIADFLVEYLQPLGVGVIMEGIHMCTVMRGIKKANVRMITSAMRGAFRDNLNTRNEFLHLAIGFNSGNNKL